MRQEKMREMPNSDGFAARLKEVIGNESVSSFSKRCGFSEGLTRRYLLGTQPGIENLIALAAAAGVTIEWLATGNAKSPRKTESDLLKSLRDAAMARFRRDGCGSHSFGGFDEAGSDDVMALCLIKGLSGLSVGQARQVLRRAEFWLDATSTFDAGASEFQRADEALLASFGKEAVERLG